MDPEDRQMLVGDMGHSSFSLNEIDLTEINHEVIETTDKSRKFTCNITAKKVL